MASATAREWAKRTNNVKTLVNDEQFSLAEKEARLLIDDPTLPHYYRIQNLVLLAQCTEDWYESKVYILAGVEGKTRADFSIALSERRREYVASYASSVSC